MSVYFNKRRKWWEYYFRFQKKIFTRAGFKTKKEALAAEAERKKDVKQPITTQEQKEIDMAFLDLVNSRLDYLQAYRSKTHYIDSVYLAKRWVRQFKDMTVHQISPELIGNFLIKLKNKVSAFTANKDLRALRATFNFGIKPPNRWFTYNPTDGLKFFPVESKMKYVPPLEDVIKVLMVAEGEVQDYLWTLALTMGRMSEINKLEKTDIDFQNGYVTLYTRKTKGGNTRARKIPMTKKLREVFERRLHKNTTPWVFYHTYFSRKQKYWVTGPYKSRNKIMTTLCKKAGVRYFRFHPFRHFGASYLENHGVSIKTIQELLGHQNRLTTEIYVHSLNNIDRDAMDCLDSALNGVENVLEFRKAQD